MSPRFWLRILLPPLLALGGGCTSSPTVDRFEITSAEKNGPVAPDPTVQGAPATDGHHGKEQEGMAPASVDRVDPDHFDGTWILQKDRSSPIDPWRGLTLTIDASETELLLMRVWKGSYGYSVVDSVRIPIDGQPHPIPIHTWPDNRHIGVFVGTEEEKTVAATWLDNGRTLGTTTRLAAATSQGRATLRIRSEYRLGPARRTLTLLELRSTRPRPIRYVFRPQSAPER